MTSPTDPLLNPLPDPLTSPHLSAFPHGFFTRTGGVSQDLYASLNLGRGSQDEPDHVARNRARVQAHFSADQLMTAYQIHSDICQFYTPSGDNGADHAPTPPQADALVTTTPGIAIGVLTADCAPILFADSHHPIVGAAHAGWRGAVGGIIEATLACLIDHGAKRETLTAVIGPCISLPNYEVGDAFYETLQTTAPDAQAFCTRLGPYKSWHFDLSGYCADRLARAGIAHTPLNRCTYGSPEQFFSYRYNTHRGEGDYGRQGSFIMIPKATQA